MQFSALCWGLASAYRLAMDHSQRVEAKTGNENIPSKTHDVPVQPIESGVQTQQKDTAVSETEAQATNQEVNAVPTTTSDVPIPSTGGGVQTQHEANAVSETQTQAEFNTAPACSVGTETQAANVEVAISTKSTETAVITIAPIKKKKAWTKETAEPTDPSPQLERVGEEEGEEEEGPIPSTLEVADEGATVRDERAAVMDEGAAVRDEEMAVMMEGAMAREERVVTIEEGAAAREGEVVTRHGAHLMGLGTHAKELGVRPKESRGASKERKETVQVTQGRTSLNDMYPDCIFRFPQDVKRRSTHLHQPEEEPFLPLQM
ncbi:hypothetical protein WISP_48416 [Willisornis vidua]|uniref:Uncharacterized protein n=1 Tax=Willisornis vidua TaxID=1566151 RepID=A0ABQ9DEG3_9PASS|nr:hypothetical protein WISP_48416 [Willisornis vidua]